MIGPLLFGRPPSVVSDGLLIWRGPRWRVSVTRVNGGWEWHLLLENTRQPLVDARSARLHQSSRAAIRAASHAIRSVARTAAAITGRTT